MINILLKGVDEFLGSEVEKTIVPKVAKLLKINEDEIFVTCLHSMIYHQGVDQTSFHMIVTFEMTNEYQKYELELVKLILELSKNFSVHAHVNFTYFSKGFYSRIDNNYPLFVTENNQVNIENESDEDDDIYLGDIFADFNKNEK